MIKHDPMISAAQEALDARNWPLLAALATVLQELDIWELTGIRACWKPGDREHDHDQCIDAVRDQQRVIGERTTLVPLVRAPRAHQPVYGRAHCSVCRTLIAAYGWTREQTGYPDGPAGPAEFTEWRHTPANSPAARDLNIDHKPTPERGTVIGLLPPFADARPGSDGYTPDWTPQEPQSHAPQVCRCGQPAVWRDGVWRHLEHEIDAHHAPNLSTSDR